MVKYQLELLKKTKLVDFAMDKYRLLHKTEEVPEGACDILLCGTLCAGRSLLKRSDVAICGTLQCAGLCVWHGDDWD